MKETVSFPDPNWQKVMDLFDNLCVYCWGKAVTVHEIEPKSLRKDWQVISNRIPLCNTCHTFVHDEGTRKYADTLRAKAMILLEALEKNVLEWING